MFLRLWVSCLTLGAMKRDTQDMVALSDCIVTADLAVCLLL